MELVSREPKVVLGTDPAANTEFSVTVPTEYVWRLLSVSVSLVQGITQTPRPALVIDDGVTTIFESWGAGNAGAVDTTCQYTWGVGLRVENHAGSTTNVRAMGPLPENMIVPGGYRIRSVTNGIGANSNYGPPALYVIEYRPGQNVLM